MPKDVIIFCVADEELDNPGLGTKNAPFVVSCPCKNLVEFFGDWQVVFDRQRYIKPLRYIPSKSLQEIGNISSGM
jgi:hypothetical protein